MDMPNELDPSTEQYFIGRDRLWNISLSATRNPDGHTCLKVSYPGGSGTYIVGGGISHEDVVEATDSFNARIRNGGPPHGRPEPVPPIPLNAAEILDQTDLRRERNRPVAEAGNAVREREDTGAMSLR